MLRQRILRGNSGRPLTLSLTRQSVITETLVWAQCLCSSAFDP